ncbi:MAG: hypothetical protein D6726_07075 [Nitrospirae bacterium]|nr:MAG: hypothetical protein D6726_07075 [Nitrospirota bacterium]
MRRSPIDSLIEEVWDCCITRLLPKDREMRNRWEEDELTFLREGFRLAPLPEKLKPLTIEALAQWKEREEKVLERLKMDREVFLREFNLIRDSYLNKENNWQTPLLSMAHIVYGAVRNMDWVTLFTWILPITDSENAAKYLEAGKMITALFYLEILYKYLANPQGCHALDKIETRWQMACREI